MTIERNVCKRGHELVDENTIYSHRKNGRVMRRCRICEKALRAGEVPPMGIVPARSEEAIKKQARRELHGVLTYDKAIVVRSILDDLGKVYAPREEEEVVEWQGWGTV